MKTITIFISETEPRFQVIPSDGVEPQMGIRAGRYCEAVFQQAAMDAEIERRIAEREKEVQDDSTGAGV